jgi:hypothetical protein
MKPPTNQTTLRGYRLVSYEGGGRSGGLLSALPKFPETIALGFHLVVLSLGADA